MRALDSDVEADMNELICTLNDKLGPEGYMCTAEEDLAGFIADTAAYEADMQQINKAIAKVLQTRQAVGAALQARQQAAQEKFNSLVAKMMDESRQLDSGPTPKHVEPVFPANESGSADASGDPTNTVDMGDDGTGTLTTTQDTSIVHPKEYAGS